MATYRTVSLNFWTDPKVDDDFTPEDKYFYLYLITNPHTNICGCYEVGKKQIERETGYTWDSVLRLLNRMSEVHNVIRYDEMTKEVLLLNWGKYNWSTSEKLIAAVESVAKGIKNSGFRNYVIQNVRERTFSAPAEETEVKEEPKKVKRFVKPTIDEVTEYCRERGNKVDPQKFVDYYESNGWKIGGRGAMKDWKAAVRTWEKNDFTAPAKKKERDFGFKGRDYNFETLEEKLLQY